MNVKNVIFPWRGSNSVDFYNDGEQFYPAMLKSIDNAKTIIQMEMYLFESGQVLNQFVESFTSASRRGVSVQLLLDAYGTLNLSEYDRKKLIESGVELAFYNPLLFSKLKKNLFRTHRKYLLIDGAKAFVGGAGITDSFLGERAWRETVIQIQGEVVADWHSLFNSNFKNWSKSPAPDISLSNELHGTVKARVVYTTGGSYLEIKKMLLNRINNSHSHVWFASAYFIPSGKIRKSLRKAAQNGRDVRLLLPGPVTDHPGVRHASRWYYAKLLRFGVRIFEYQERFTHTKMIIVDDWFTIGSSNMDRWNFRWNLEANQEIEDVIVTKQAQNIMTSDFSNCCEITYQQWCKRSKYQRFQEWFWNKVDQWLTKT